MEILYDYALNSVNTPPESVGPKKVIKETHTYSLGAVVVIIRAFDKIYLHLILLNIRGISP